MVYPSWEQIKDLDRSRIWHFTIWECESIDVSGVITLFEEYEDTDPDYMIYFDVWENGYTDKNDIGGYNGENTELLRRSRLYRRGNIRIPNRR